jgi:sterol desaturase/sphingolipid hydroxylase (fatty acid hydroxylase superfamily)
MIGASPCALSVWQTGLLVWILFHHSIFACPYRVERLLVRVIVAPPMHGIEHSTARDAGPVRADV